MTIVVSNNVTNVQVSDAAAARADRLLAEAAAAAANGVVPTTTGIIRATNIAALRTNTPVANQLASVSGYYSNGDGGGGEFYGVTGGTYTDDGALTIVPGGGTGSTAWKRIVNGPLDVRWFGAKGDGATNDTTAVQAAVNATAAGGSLIFSPGSYNVTTIDTGTCEAFWVFDNSELLAGATSATDCLLRFQGFHTTIHNLKLNGNFNLNYTCMLWWYNASYPSQYNTFFGMQIRYAKRGIIYGELPGSTSTGYAQSENSVFGFQARGVEKLIYANHANGVLFFSGSQLVAHDDEWSVYSPGNFDYTQNRCFESVAGAFIVEGSEIQNSIADTSGYCASVLGGEVHLNGCMCEMDVPFYVDGKLFLNGSRVLNTQSTTDQFFFPTSASASSRLNVYDSKIYRVPTVGSFSSNSLVYNTGASADIECRFDNCNIDEWSQNVPLVSSNNQSAHFNNCRWYPDGTQDAHLSVYNLNTSGADYLDRPGIDVKGYTSDGFYFYNSYGAGTTHGLSADVPNSYYANSLYVNSVGQAGYFTSDPTSLSTVKNTAMRVKEGDKLSIEGWIRYVSGGGNQAAASLLLFDDTGSFLSFLTVFSQNNGFITSSWKYLRNVVIIPSGSTAAYAGFGAHATATEVRFCGLKVRRANWNAI